LVWVSPPPIFFNFNKVFFQRNMEPKETEAKMEVPSDLGIVNENSDQSSSLQVDSEEKISQKSEIQTTDAITKVETFEPPPEYSNNQDKPEPPESPKVSYRVGRS
jgi:hypothetical protein